MPLIPTNLEVEGWDPPKIKLNTALVDRSTRFFYEDLTGQDKQVTWRNFILRVETDETERFDRTLHCTVVSDSYEPTQGASLIPIE